MYLHIGDDICLLSDKIIGVFDLDKSTVGKTTREFLSTAEKNLGVTYLTPDIPKSFIVATGRVKTDVFLVTVSPGTIKKRLKASESYKGVNDGRKN